MKKNDRKRWGSRAVWVWLLAFTAVLFFSGNQPAKAAYAKPYLIKVNKQSCVVTVYEKDKKGNYTVPVKAMLCSPGAATPLGTFYTPSRYRWHVLDGNVWGQYCTRIHGGVLFHSVWYYQRDPSTLSVKQYNKLGTQCSHGCVRLNVADAKWIYDNCSLGTKVVVYNSGNPGPLGKPKALKITNGKYTDWDPTDVWSPGNPYIKTKPKITGAKNRKLNYGDKVDVKDGVKAISSTGDNITSSMSVSIQYDGKKVKKVNTKVAGVYYVTYKAKDSTNRSAAVTVKYTVVDNVKPVISGTKNLYTNQPENVSTNFAMKNVKAKWHGKNVTDDVLVEIKKISSESGLKVYSVRYSIKTENGKSASSKKKLYLDTKAPVLEGIKDRDINWEQTEETAMMSLARKDVTVSDNLAKLKQSDITVKINKESDTVYEIVYSVKDSVGNKTQETAEFTVIDAYHFEGVEDRAVSADTEITEEFVKKNVRFYHGVTDVTNDFPMTVSITEAANGQYIVVYTVEVTITDSKGKATVQKKQATAVFTKESEPFGADQGQEATDGGDSIQG